MNLDFFKSDPSSATTANKEKAYNKPCFDGPKTVDSLLEETKQADPLILHFDVKFNKSREQLIFMEETKIWQDVLQDCVDRAGVNAGKECRRLHEMIDERIKYYNSGFNATQRPNMTPGLPAPYERIIISDSKEA